MTNLETIIILDGRLPEKRVKEILVHYSHLITNMLDATDMTAENIGLKQLAYVVGGCREGYYLIFHYNGDRTQLDKLEQKLRDDKMVLKYLNTTCTTPSGASSASEQKPKQKKDAFDIIYGTTDE